MFRLSLIYLLSASSKQRQLPEDWDHFHVLLEQLLHRVPSLKSAVLDRLCNGPEAFSPDCKWIVGEAPEVCIYILFPKGMSISKMLYIRFN